METYLDCIPCFFKQALEAAKITGAEHKIQREVLLELARALPEFPLTSSPPEMGRIIYGIVKKITRQDDPYIDLKDKSNRIALNVYPRLKKKVEISKDRLLTAVELAIAGNIIDYGAKNSLNVDVEIAKILDEENEAIKNESKTIFDYAGFKDTLVKAKNVLYLADNCGETVFDRILIEEIRSLDDSKEIIYAVKEKPIINDALMEDALKCGIDKLAKVMSSGSDAPGTVLSLCSKEFLTIYEKADMIISKGQGKFEALSQATSTVFFLFMAK